MHQWHNLMLVIGFGCVDIAACCNVVGGDDG